MSNNFCSREFLQWLEQKSHLEKLLKEQPLRKDDIVKHLDRMVAGDHGWRRDDRIRELEGVEGILGVFRWAGDGWEVVDGFEVVIGRGRGDGGVYTWESKGEELDVVDVGVRERMGERSASEGSGFTREYLTFFF